MNTHHSDRNTGSPTVTTLLWTAIAVCAGINTGLSMTGHVAFGAIAGIVAVVLLVAVGVRNLRHRRQ
ncbi:hypothetical protein [Haloglycomyces albus]|uniref:hypothetical protein n=1 Tax=Haloglycomyces albus TaxID=526067 RepID=UPI00046CB392|nr:hypothetical protein [Haloglycomyces albus]